MNLKLGILISGRGSNMAALLDACAAPGFPAAPAIILSDRPDAAGLETTRRAGVAAEALDRNAFASRAGFEAALTQRLEAAEVGLVCLAGFMRVLSADFVARWRGRLINIHPSLLPAFKGLDTHRRALDAGVKLHGCTVHYVSEGVDEGPIVGQAAVPVLPDDTEEALAARVLAAEHRLYPRCVRLIAEGRVELRGSVAVLKDSGAASAPLFMPPLRD